MGRHDDGTRSDSNHQYLWSPANAWDIGNMLELSADAYYDGGGVKEGAKAFLHRRPLIA
jgi:hypothetical protein